MGKNHQTDSQIEEAHNQKLIKTKTIEKRQREIKENLQRRLRDHGECLSEDEESLTTPLLHKQLQYFSRKREQMEIQLGKVNYKIQSLYKKLGKKTQQNKRSKSYHTQREKPIHHEFNRNKFESSKQEKMKSQKKPMTYQMINEKIQKSIMKRVLSNISQQSEQKMSISEKVLMQIQRILLPLSYLERKTSQQYPHSKDTKQKKNGSSNQNDIIPLNLRSQMNSQASRNNPISENPDDDDDDDDDDDSSHSSSASEDSHVQEEILMERQRRKRLKQAFLLDRLDPNTGKYKFYDKNSSRNRVRRQNQYKRYGIIYSIDSYYLSFIPPHFFKFFQFLQHYWQDIEFLELKSNAFQKISQDDWERFIENAFRLPNLKLLQISNNLITHVKKQDLTKFKELRYINFGKKIQCANPLSQQSVQNLRQFKTQNPHVKIGYHIPI